MEPAPVRVLLSCDAGGDARLSFEEADAARVAGIQCAWPGGSGTGAPVLLEAEATTSFSWFESEGVVPGAPERPPRAPPAAGGGTPPPPGRAAAPHARGGRAAPGPARRADRWRVVPSRSAARSGRRPRRRVPVSPRGSTWNFPTATDGRCR